MTLCKYKHCSSSAVNLQHTHRTLTVFNFFFIVPASKQCMDCSFYLFFLVSTFSAAFLPGVPVAGRFCSLCNGRLPVHWVLLQRCRCQKRGQHRSHLVCPDCSLQLVSFHCKVTSYTQTSTPIDPPKQNCLLLQLRSLFLAINKHNEASSHSWWMLLFPP